MKIIKYFIEFIFIFLLLVFFRLLGYKNASNLGEKIGKLIGPIFRSKKKIIENLKNSKIVNNQNDIEKIIDEMFGNYGRILSEYPFLNKFKKNLYNQHLNIEGINYFEEIKKNKKKVVFVSGHFNNFELMAMQIENAGIDVAAVYRPLNNFFLNFIMEKIRIKNICKTQVKKGKAGTRQLLELFKSGSSIALMIDQRVSEGVKVNFFGRPAFTTTIPAQLVKKYNCEIVPVYIERINKINFKMHVNKPIKFENNLSIDYITEKLNIILEEMVLKNPEQWIWSHDRWK